MNDRSDDGPDRLAAIADLQMRLTYQDDDIKQLNLAVARQQAEIDVLRLHVKRLMGLIDAMAASRLEPGAADEPPPPHY